LCISKQTKNIVETVLGENRSKDKIIEYVPHGINSDVYKPLRHDDKLTEFKNTIFKNKKFDFVALFNSRNIRRKMVSDLMIAFKQFKNSLPKNKQDKVALMLKTAPVDNNGTDLLAIKDDILRDTNVVFVPHSLDQAHMNYLYNIADVTLNVSSAEGFGLSFAESIMAGTPTIANCIGGLQDQMRFEDENGN
jgi:glycosyltransferase involved in cell wall biosynthesis